MLFVSLVLSETKVFEHLWGITKHVHIYLSVEKQTLEVGGVGVHVYAINIVC